MKILLTLLVFILNLFVFSCQGNEEDAEDFDLTINQKKEKLQACTSLAKKRLLQDKVRIKY